MTIQIPNRVKTLRNQEQKEYDEKPFPLILTPATEGEFRDASDLQNWLSNNTATLKSLLVEYGAIAFRGFDLPTPSHFNDFCNSLGTLVWINAKKI